STPPAFILSQDQTLMLKSSIGQSKLAIRSFRQNLNLLFLKVLIFIKNVRQIFKDLLESIH
ncbi:MAG: hypothetical protein ACI4F0_03545, partial [Agathobacter sp.]